MKKYNSGDSALYGIYIAPAALDFRFVGADGERLEGKDKTQYYRLPAPLVVAASPALGGIFVLGFPLLVVGFVAFMIGKLAVAQARSFYAENAHLSTMRWEPTTAYLNKVDRKTKSKQADESDKK